MFGRYSADSWHHVARQVRHHIGTAYAHARHFASTVDRGINLASRVYAAANPVLRDVAPELEKRVTAGVVQAKSSYDQMRGDAVSIHDRGAAHAERLRGIPGMLGL